MPKHLQPPLIRRGELSQECRGVPPAQSTIGVRAYVAGLNVDQKLEQIIDQSLPAIDMMPRKWNLLDIEGGALIRGPLRIGSRQQGSQILGHKDEFSRPGLILGKASKDEAQV
jgi:hypothetical protein